LISIPHPQTKSAGGVWICICPRLPKVRDEN
jgi:hypothetical protein